MNTKYLLLISIFLNIVLFGFSILLIVDHENTGVLLAGIFNVGVSIWLALKNISFYKQLKKIRKMLGHE